MDERTLCQVYVFPICLFVWFLFLTSLSSVRIICRHSRVKLADTGTTLKEAESLQRFVPPAFIRTELDIKMLLLDVPLSANLILEPFLVQ